MADGPKQEDNASSQREQDTPSASAPDAPAPDAPAPDAPATNATSASEADAGASTSAPHKQDSEKKGRATTWAWVVGIVTILAAELYVYGHDGWIRVCIGKEGKTDFTLLDKPRQPGSSGPFPICAERLNLGMYSNGDDIAREALEHACFRGATLMGGDQRDCIRKDEGWTRRVDKQHIPPWDRRLYRRLLFLD